MAGIGLERISAFVMAVPDLVGARESFVRLGLSVTAPAPVGEAGLECCLCSVGGPDRSVRVELLSFRDLDRANVEARHEQLVRLIDAGGGSYQLGLEVSDADVARSVLNAEPGGLDERLVTMGGGSAVRILAPRDTSVCGCRYVIVDHSSVGDHADTAMRDSPFPMKRVDHIALVPPEIEAGTRYWTDVLGVPVYGEVPGPGFLIRQLQVGDIMVELLASDDPNGPLAGAAPGLRPTVACEVEDVHASVAMARERGFTVPDPGPGALPGTLVAIISPEELAGLSLQLLQYV